MGEAVGKLPTAVSRSRNILSEIESIEKTKPVKIRGWSGNSRIFPRATCAFQEATRWLLETFAGACSPRSCRAKIRLNASDPSSTCGSVRYSYPAKCTATPRRVPTEGCTTRNTLPWQRTGMLSPRVIADGITSLTSIASPAASGKSVYRKQPRALRSCVNPLDSCREPVSLIETATWTSKRCPQRRSRQSGVVVMPSSVWQRVPGWGDTRTIKNFTAGSSPWEVTFS